MRDYFYVLTEMAGNWAYGLLFIVSIFESLAFVGLIVPGTTIVIVAGILASQGVLDIRLLIVPVILGGIVGDALSYYVGRQGFARGGLKGRFVKEEYLEKGQQFFARHGSKSVFLARFIGPLRPIVPVVAGLTGMPRRTFFFYNITSACLFAPCYLLFGYFFGTAWEKLRHLTGWVEIAVLALIIGVGAFFVSRKEWKILKK